VRTSDEYEEAERDSSAAGQTYHRRAPGPL